jgi:hypothetical protein
MIRTLISVSVLGLLASAVPDGEVALVHALAVGVYHNLLYFA